MSKKEKIKKIDTAKQHTLLQGERKKSKTTGRNYFWHRAEIISANSNFYDQITRATLEEFFPFFFLWKNSSGVGFEKWL